MTWLRMLGIAIVSPLNARIVTRMSRWICNIGATEITLAISL